ncbi:uncharacterized protein LOC134194262 isoform X2 [Corticium candelabrum]|uniref:uncharacterized protein LOC134193987 isoform X2 n=1 Tax=Corticium candelabrum TaxID=121492 RepID=UPI002E256A70|nr:uncharacterized protein LOC134193987 isoform X2 [Corticium candelabrum]XP_062519169.1 uncharacterized protein LOC134194262 isoform X2 [Corticium candelabrum]
MPDMQCLSGLSFGGLCLMLANTTKLKQCVCVGVKVPSEESVGDMFSGVSAGDVLVLSNKSSVEELVDLLYVHRRAAKTVESLIECTDSLTTNSSEVFNSQKKSKHKISFMADWMTHYPWLLAIPDEDEPEKIHGLICMLC